MPDDDTTALGPSPWGSRLLGSAEEQSHRRRVRVQLLVTAGLTLANLVGLVVALVLMVFVLGSGTPVALLMAVAVLALAGRTVSTERLAVCVLAISGVRTAPTGDRLRAQSADPVSKARNRSAATLTAMTAGSLPVMSASPIGVLMRASASRG